MTSDEALLAFPGAPVGLWLRVLGHRAGEPVDDALLLSIEVLNALRQYHVVPMSSTDAVFAAADAFIVWANVVTESQSQSSAAVAVVNARYVCLRVRATQWAAVDMTTGDTVAIPDDAAPVVTTVIHLPALRQQTLSNLERGKKAEERPVPPTGP